MCDPRRPRWSSSQNLNWALELLLPAPGNAAAPGAAPPTVTTALPGACSSASLVAQDPAAAARAPLRPAPQSPLLERAPAHLRMHRTRLACTKNHHGNKPRRIHVVEHWRRFIAKKLLPDNVSVVQNPMLSQQQYFITVPSVVVPLNHTRRGFRESIQTDLDVDVDMANAFTSITGPLTWPSASKCSPSPTEPGGVTGLPPSSLQMAHTTSPTVAPSTATPSSAHCRPLSHEHANTSAPTSKLRPARRTRPAYLAPWFASDGPIYARPDRVNPFLRLLDAKIEPSICTRGEIPTAKSAVTFIVRQSDTLAAPPRLLHRVHHTHMSDAPQQHDV